MIPHLAALKEATDINCGTLSQRILAQYLSEGHLQEHIVGLRTIYRERRDALLMSLTRHFEGLARWNNPSGGVFLWLELHEDIDTAELLAHALSSEKVAFVPGACFSADGTLRAERCMRLNFSHLAPCLLEEGVVRLARSVTSFSGRNDQLSREGAFTEPTVS
jgi:DNA-binding transcriptional MocR family regulator